MLGTFFQLQMAQSVQAARLRSLAVLSVFALLAAWAVTGPDTAPRLVELVAWTQLFASIVVGGALTGWRVAQFPKSRAAEFHLVTPVPDWQWIAAEVGWGMLRTSFVVIAGAPAVAALWAAGWICAAQAAALLFIPLAGGWLSGIMLAVIAYEPLWLRRLLGHAVLASILAYLIVFGLAGRWVGPRILAWYTSWRNVSFVALADVEDIVREMNPFRLLGTLGRVDLEGLGTRVASIVGLLLFFSLLGFWRLVCRLRRHYLEENYGHVHAKKEYGSRIADNPLAWWTARRVSRFKANVNLYLAWAVVGIFSIWLFERDRWPLWLGRDLMSFLESHGGAAMLAVVALQLATVPAAFLSGMWDSNLQQRLGRLELLLVTPLTPRQYMWASLVAVWTRGRGYVLAMLVPLIAMCLAGHQHAVTYLVLCLVAANYFLLTFAVAFRNFARTSPDRKGAAWGLAMSIGVPLLVWGLFAVRMGYAAAITPLGAIYLAAQSTGEQMRLSGLSPVVLWIVINCSTIVYFLLSMWLLHKAVQHFDQEIRSWFANHLYQSAGGG